MRKLFDYSLKVARLSAFLLACAALFLFVNYRIARASVMDRLFGIGMRMAPYLDDGRTTESPRLMKINGIAIAVAVGHTDHPPNQVKQWYVDRYAAKGDGLDDFGKQLKKRGVYPPSAPALNQATFGNDQHGGVVALDYGENSSMKGILARVTRFARTGQLGQIASLRYAYYEKEKQGTRFLTVWTDEKFDLSKLISTDALKDSPGSDIPKVPRYPGTVRVLSGEESGMPQRLVVYDGPGSPDAAAMFYQARMATLGWQLDPTFEKIATEQRRQAMKFENDEGHEVVIDLSSHKDGQGLTVAAIQTR